MNAKKNPLSRRMALALAAATAAGVFSGCSGTKTNTQSSSGSGEPVTVTIWDTQATAYDKMGYKTPNDTPYVQALSKATGVKIEFVDGTGGADKLNLLIASNATPDIVIQNWITYPGGPSGAIANKVIIPLNKLWAQNAPNYKKYLTANPDIAKAVKTDDGQYYCFASLYAKDVPLLHNSANGLFLRSDWLKDLGLATPATISDWENVLTAFKNQKTGGSAPFVWEPWMSGPGQFEYAYGVIGDDLYVDNGKIKFAPLQAGYKTWLQQMNAWTQAGLIDKDCFTAKDGNGAWAKISSNKAGAVNFYIGSGLKKTASLVSQNPGLANVAAVAYPSLQSGTKADVDLQPTNWNYSAGVDAAISAVSKHPEAAMKVEDYFYSEAGQALGNYGIEGKSYTVSGGKHVFTDEVLKNAKGASFTEALSAYAGPQAKAGIESKEFADQLYSLDSQQAALKTLTSTGKLTALPPLTLTAAESTAVTSKLNDIKTYVSENKMKFILGVQQMSAYDAFTAQLSKMGVDDIVKIYQNALDRYNARK